MTTQIAFLRAVNVGGNAKLPMADLRAAAEKLKLKHVSTLLQSGNLLFATSARPLASEKLLEAMCAANFGLKTNIFVRTHAEIEDLIAGNPFRAEAKSDPGHLLVLLMRDAPDAKSFKKLQSGIVGRELVRGAGRHAYITFPEGAGASKLTLAMIERHLGTTGTMRNWNTIRKLAARAAG
jgi:uncharacterized protein (DUF1697 family)